MSDLIQKREILSYQAHSFQTAIMLKVQLQNIHDMAIS